MPRVVVLGRRTMVFFFARGCALCMAFPGRRRFGRTAAGRTWRLATSFHVSCIASSSGKSASRVRGEARPMPRLPVNCCTLHDPHHSSHPLGTFVLHIRQKTSFGDEACTWTKCRCWCCASPLWFPRKIGLTSFTRLSQQLQYNYFGTIL